MSAVRLHRTNPFALALDALCPGARVALDRSGPSVATVSAEHGGRRATILAPAVALLFPAIAEEAAEALAHELSFEGDDPDVPA